MLVSFSHTKLTHQKPNRDQAWNAYILGNIVVIINKLSTLTSSLDYYTSNSLTSCGNALFKQLYLAWKQEKEAKKDQSKAFCNAENGEYL